MQEQTHAKSSSAFLKTDGGKTKSDAIEIPSIALPKGGGSIRGIDEKFSVNAINGTSSFSIPLPFSKARSLSPALNISYNSGTGNGIFGLGWNLGLSSIKRKTDKCLPQYDDEADTFLFSDAEDFVPELKKDLDGSFIRLADGSYVINERDSDDGLFRIISYKPRIEGLFARIEKWTSHELGETRWKITTRDNSTTLFGWSQQARIANPAIPSHIFEWLPEFIFDDKGNCSHYIYKHDNEAGFDTSLLHNRNRLKNEKITYTNCYLESVLYGNKTPYKGLGNTFPDEGDYMFQTVFDYGTLLPADTLETTNVWDFRPDAFSDYKAGFEIRTTRLCTRVLLFHVFDELALKPDKSDKKTLIKSVNFNYDTASEQDFTFLQSITSFGYIKKPDGSYSFKKLPPIEFVYQKHEWNSEIKSIYTESFIHAPAGLDEQQYQFTDLYNEGLSGILHEQAYGWYYKRDLGNGVFEQASLVSPKPSFSGLGRQLQLLDLDGDGGKQLVSFGVEPTGYFKLDTTDEWQNFQSFKSLPNIDFGDANTRMLDLDGDGKPEVVISEEDVFTWYGSEGRNGYSAARKTTKPIDEEAGPHIVFSDTSQSIYLADMSGDGLTDILRIRNGDVCYWPNLGYGKFGNKIALDNAPLFDHPDHFNPTYLRLADIDGSGTSDIIYLGKNKFTCWKNLSGNRFSTLPFEIENFPTIHALAKITVTDLLGNGVACIVWSSPLPGNDGAPWKYIDLMNGRKPHVLVQYKNNLGKEVALEYSPSTRFYLEDKTKGNPWVTKLHFPVHCLTKTTTEDKISGYKFVSEYAYHHGYYDHAEKEFRGFGMVEQTDSETFEHWVRSGASNATDATLHQEPVITKTWNHTGVFSQKGRTLDQFAKDYWYNELERQNFPVIHHELPLPDARLVAAPGIDPVILDHLSIQEWQEAIRACKGMGLRSEIFTKDAIKYGNTEEAKIRELTPYSVSRQNCVIELLQPKGKNKHAVFIVKESEAITYNYERNPEDPRIAHSLNIRLDEYGNVLESASVVYPRLTIDTSLPLETRQQQNKTFVIYTESQFTNDAITPESYRLRLPSETKTFELKGVAKTGIYYSTNDFNGILTSAKSDSASYHELDKPLTIGKAQKRITEHVRTNYYQNDLSGSLPLHQLESLGLHFESYQLGYTPELLANIYSAKANDSVLEDLMSVGEFSHSVDSNGNPDSDWWIRSGTIQFKTTTEGQAVARQRFYVPISYTDPYGAATRVKYYKYHFLFIEETEDALGNISKVENLDSTKPGFNFRTLSPAWMKDMNGNYSAAISDELGLIKAAAIIGKGDEADDLVAIKEISDDNELNLISQFFQAPDSVQLTALGKDLLKSTSSRFVYDFEAYTRSGKPAVVAAIVREQHAKQLVNSPVQIAFEYSNGIGEVIMKKVQAEPGKAKQVIVHSDNTYTLTTPDPDTSAFNPSQLRWLGNGRTIKNNKGNAVKQYEPYFSITWQYEHYKELVETGVTPVMFYDATGRLINTEMPDGSFSKVEFDSWMQKVYDANDTVLESEWYKKRTVATHPDFIADVNEQQAAAKAAKHANTPNALYLDTLGRPVLSIDHNKNITTGADEFYLTKIKLDTEGNLRSITDARGNTVMRYKYNMLGAMVYQQSMDAGQRWLLTNILGKPLRTWDERDHEFQYFYDIAQRPTHSKVISDGTTPLNHIFDRVIYGESLLIGDRTDTDRLNEADLQSRNVLGKAVQHYDTGGLIATSDYDFKGQPLATTRKLFSKYKEVANWSDANLIIDLESGTGFTFKTDTDALSRITRQTAPDGSIITPAYNEAGLLNGETVQHPGGGAASMYIRDINYNEKGQREKIIYGNNVSTRFHYDKETFRLKQLESKRLNGDVLQNLFYTFDAVGNITQVEDKAIPVNFFANSVIEPISEYTYDALYRLTAATGRENNAALNFGTCDHWNDKPFLNAMNPGNPMAVRNYRQSYQYDAVGNIREMRHLAAGGNWTRTYEYENASNRLTSTSKGDNGNTANYTKYSHHAQHGFMEELPHLEKIGWNFKEEVVLTTRQHCTDDNIPVITYYQYDGSGQRIRKITENQSAAGGVPSIKEERIYISGYELYKKHTGTHAGLERESLSLMDGTHRFVMIETRNNINDGTEKQLVRYQLHNHLGSAALELDGTTDSKVISYEEYHPFGTTAYQAINTAIKSAAKRYRFTGMERDEETGLEYHSARYYLPWLGRWLSSDPIGITGGVNAFTYCLNNPVCKSDTNGMQSAPAREEVSPIQLTPLLTEISPLNVSGHIQFHNLLSSNISVSGKLGLATGIRTSFGLNIPSLGLNTSGFADGQASARVDTAEGTGHLSLRGGAVVGDTSGLHLTAIGSASLHIPVPGEISINDAVSTLGAALPHSSGDLQLHGGIAAGSIQLAEFNATSLVHSGRFRGAFDARTIMNVGRLHLDAIGTVDATGTPSISAVSATADLNLGLLSFSASGSGSGKGDGSLSYSVNGDLHILGLQSLQMQGSGIASSTGASFTGTFSGPGPLYSSYIFGDFSLSSANGIAARGGMLGLTYMPGITTTDPSPITPGMRAIGGDPLTPWTPSGLVLGATFVDYSQGNVNWFSAGVLPDLSNPANLQLGLTAQGHF